VIFDLRLPNLRRFAPWTGPPTADAAEVLCLTILADASSCVRHQGIGRATVRGSHLITARRATLAPRFCHYGIGQGEGQMSKAVWSNNERGFLMGLGLELGLQRRA